MNPSQTIALHQRQNVDIALGANPSSEWVPIAEHVIFLDLVDVVLRYARTAREAELAVYMDGHTAHNAHALEELSGIAAAVHVAGVAPHNGDTNSVWKSVDLPPNCEKKDHFIFLLGRDVRLLICGTAALETDERISSFQGAWTLEPVSVSRIFAAFFPETTFGGSDAKPSVDDGGMAATLAISLMACQSGDFIKRQRDMALEKADLFSVLNILKAISAHRRSHDVLYVFVEQIAQVVTSDRCSIVRVWGSANEASVLASHEDADVNGQVIELQKYPELIAAMDNRKKIVVQDINTDPLTDSCKEDLNKAGIRALLVVPIVLFDDHVGTLLLRAARKNDEFSRRDLSFFEIVAEAASNALERAHLFESIQKANERLEQLAITDSLTGLFNRRYLHDQFDHEFQRAKRYSLPLACLMLDIDSFKKINDDHGHLQGDSILREMSERVRHNVRSIDIAARYGGEEIILLMPQTDLDGAEVEAERLRKLISGAPYRGLPAEAVVTVSIGVAVLDTETMNAPDDLVRLADKRLYDAKRAGKNRVVYDDTEGEVLT